MARTPSAASGRVRAAGPAGLSAALVLLLAACTVGPSQRPAVAVRGENLPVPVGVAPPTPGGPAELPGPEPTRTTIAFVDCTEDTFSTLLVPPPADRKLQVECGSIDVPSDPDRPDGGRTELTVLRVGLAGTPPDRPSLAVVGDSATEPSARAALRMAGQVPVELLSTYSLVGIDRRGAGADELDCAPQSARAALVDADPAAADEAALGRLLDRARDVVQECTLALDGGLGPFRSATTSGDLEVLRQALGVGRLSAVGIGDGAAAVAGWVRAAPQAAGRVVLDGPPQPGLDDPDLVDGRAKATEAAFDAFAATCRSRADCPLGGDPRAATTGLVATLQTRPITIATGDRLTAGAALLAVRLGLSEPATWPALASAIAAAGAGDAGPLLAVLDPVLGPRGRFDGMLATACNDTRRRLSPAEAVDVAARMRAAYPLFGGSMAMQLVACAPWSTGGPLPPAGAAAPPPLLVLGAAADPRSTLDGARRAAQESPGARFVSWQGAGTGAYPRTSCITQVVDAMLVAGTLPPDDTLCPP